MIKTTVLLLALTVNVPGVAGDTFAAGTDFTTTTDMRSETEALATGTGEAKGKELNGFISGQFLPGSMTGFVKGVNSSVIPASRGAWNGFITGTAALSPRETEDVALLPIPAAYGKEAWDGYAAGSLDYWQRKP
jgi:hypothetical protein